MVSPVDGGWGTLNIEDGWLSSGFSFTFVSEELAVLFLGPGGEEVMSNGEGVGFVGVDLLVFSILGEEDLLSEGIFFLGTV